MKAPKIIVKAENFSTSFKKDMKAIFIISNEDLTSAKAVLSKIKIDNFIGICGGGTQILYMLSILTKKNKLKSIKLVDYDKRQLINFFYIIKVYKRFKDSIRYIANLGKRPDLTKGKVDRSLLIKRAIRLIGPMLFNANYGFEETNLRRPSITTNLKINLIYADFTKYIKTAKLKKGRYLIYVSNIFTYQKFSKIKNLLNIFSLFFYYIPKNIDKGKGRIRLFADIEYTKAKAFEIAKRKEILPGSVIMFYLGGFGLINRNHYVEFFLKEKSSVELLNILPKPNIYTKSEPKKIIALGDSMLPTIGYLESVNRVPIGFCTYKDVKVGDIVSYWSKGYNRKGQQRFYHRANVSHRIVGKAKTYAIIKGDNRDYLEKVPYYMINGKIIVKDKKRKKLFNR